MNQRLSCSEAAPVVYKAMLALQASVAGDISSPAAGAALVESAERHFGGLDKFDSGTRWPSFTTQGGAR
jgi:hypothetical protein